MAKKKDEAALPAKAEKPEETQAKAPVLMGAQGLVPRNMDDLWRLASAVARTELAPKDMRGKPEDCMVAMACGMEVGLSPMQALQSIAVINGHPSIWGDGAIGLVRGSGKCAYIKETSTGTFPNADYTAICETHRIGEAEPVTRTFSVADAKQAGIFGKNVHATYPKRMLQMRARSWALRDAYADVLKGLVLREEAVDMVDIGTSSLEPTQGRTPFGFRPSPSPEGFDPEKIQAPEETAGHESAKDGSDLFGNGQEGAKDAENIKLLRTQIKALKEKKPARYRQKLEYCHLTEKEVFEGNVSVQGLRDFLSAMEE